MKKSSELQRKKPKQGRSRELVESIFEATIRILPKLGSGNLTTKKIAEVAGISIGSLYQYFPNKESVLAAVLDSTSRIINSALSQRLQTLHELPTDEAIDYVVEGALEMMIGDQPLIREVYRQANELGRIPAMMKLRQSAVQQLALEVHRRYPHLDRRDCEKICFLCVNSLMGVVFTMLYDETQTWTREELAEELSRMMRAYLGDRVRNGTSDS